MSEKVAFVQILAHFSANITNRHVSESILHQHRPEKERNANVDPKRVLELSKAPIGIFFSIFAMCGEESPIDAFLRYPINGT